MAASTLHPHRPPPPPPSDPAPSCTAEPFARPPRRSLLPLSHSQPVPPPLLLSLRELYVYCIIHPLASAPFFASSPPASWLPYISSGNTRRLLVPLSLPVKPPARSEPHRPDYFVPTPCRTCTLTGRLIIRSRLISRTGDVE